jgi:hypothetical protein
LVPDANADDAARLPALYRALVSAIDAAEWDCEVSSAGPSRLGDVQREVVEVSAWTRSGHQIRVVFVADAPSGQPRPPFAALTAQVGQGGAVSNASLTDVLAHVRRHPGWEQIDAAEPVRTRPEAPNGESRAAPRPTRRLSRSSLRLRALHSACAR